MSIKKTKRTRHTEEFKAETLKLADLIGVAKAAKQLSLYESQLYAWRKALKYNASVSNREQELASENAKLKRLLAEQAEELEIVKKAATYFAKHLK
jgi:transposase